MVEYDETTGVTRWTRVVPLPSGSMSSEWLLKEPSGVDRESGACPPQESGIVEKHIPEEALKSGI